MARYRRMKEGDRNALVDTTENFQRLIDINSREDRMREVINGRLQDRNVIVELRDVFVVQYLPLDTLRKGRVQYFNRRVMVFNQAHNYQPALTVSSVMLNYPAGVIKSYVEILSARIAENRGAVDDLLVRGALRLNNGDFTGAIADFKAILEREPRNLFALFNLAGARVRMYDYIESIEGDEVPILGESEEQVRRTVDYSLVLEGYARCLEVDSTFVFARFNRANVYAKSGKVEEAIAEYTRVLEEDGDIAEAYYNRGLLYIYTGRKELANADLSKAGELGLTDSYNIIKRYCTPTNER